MRRSEYEERLKCFTKQVEELKNFKIEERLEELYRQIEELKK